MKSVGQIPKNLTQSLEQNHYRLPLASRSLEYKGSICFSCLQAIPPHYKVNLMCPWSHQRWHTDTEPLSDSSFNTQPCPGLTSIWSSRAHSSLVDGCSWDWHEHPFISLQKKLLLPNNLGMGYKRLPGKGDWMMSRCSCWCLWSCSTFGLARSRVRSTPMVGRSFAPSLSSAHTFAAWLVPQTKHKHRQRRNAFPLACVKSRGRVAHCQSKLSRRQRQDFRGWLWGGSDGTCL